MPGLNGTRQIIDLNANNGAFISILASGPVRRLIVRESLLTKAGAANVFAGLNYATPDDNFTQRYALPVPSNNNDIPQIELPDRDDTSFHGEKGLPIGNGPSVNIGQGVGAATPLLKLRSAGAAATSVEVIQIY